MENQNELSDFSKKIQEKNQKALAQGGDIEKQMQEAKELMLKNHTIAKTKMREVEGKYFQLLMKHFKDANVFCYRISENDSIQIMSKQFDNGNFGIISNEIGFHVDTQPDINFMCAMNNHAEIIVYIYSTKHRHFTREKFGVAMVDEALLKDLLEAYFDAVNK